MVSRKFSEIEIDAIGEIMNISLGSSATAISTMLDSRVDITTPSVSILTKEEFNFSVLEPAVGVEITYVTGLDGKNIMLLKRHDVKIIVELLMGMEIPDEEFELDEMNISAVCEVMNQMMGASSTALSEFLGRVVNISTPVSFEIPHVDTFKELYFQEDDVKVVVDFTLTINEKMQSEFVYVMSVELAKELVKGFLPKELLEDLDEASGDLATGNAQASQDIASVPQPIQEATQPVMAQPVMPNMAQMPQVPTMGNDAFMAQQQMMMQQMMQQIQMMQTQMAQPQKGAEQKMISAPPASHAELGVGVCLGEEQTENLELVMGVPLEVSVEIGRTQSLVKDILEYTKGTLVVLDKQAGDQVDLFVNGQCIARGDVVVVDDNFGIRITEVLRRPELI